MQEIEQALEVQVQAEEVRLSPSPSASPRSDRKAGAKKVGFPSPSVSHA